jgi:hypothetical protein
MLALTTGPGNSPPLSPPTLRRKVAATRRRPAGDTPPQTPIFLRKEPRGRRSGQQPARDVRSPRTYADPGSRGPRHPPGRGIRSPEGVHSPEASPHLRHPRTETSTHPNATQEPPRDTRTAGARHAGPDPRCSCARNHAGDRRGRRWRQQLARGTRSPGTCARPWHPLARDMCRPWQPFARDMCRPWQPFARDMCPPIAPPRPRHLPARANTHPRHPLTRRPPTRGIRSPGAHTPAASAHPWRPPTRGIRSSDRNAGRWARHAAAAATRRPGGTASCAGRRRDPGRTRRGPRPGEPGAGAACGTGSRLTCRTLPRSRGGSGCWRTPQPRSPW